MNKHIGLSTKRTHEDTKSQWNNVRVCLLILINFIIHSLNLFSFNPLLHRGFGTKKSGLVFCFIA